MLAQPCFRGSRGLQPLGQEGVIRDAEPKGCKLVVSRSQIPISNRKHSRDGTSMVAELLHVREDTPYTIHNMNPAVTVKGFRAEGSLRDWASVWWLAACRLAQPNVSNIVPDALGPDREGHPPTPCPQQTIVAFGELHLEACCGADKHNVSTPVSQGRIPGRGQPQPTSASPGDVHPKELGRTAPGISRGGDMSGRVQARPGRRERCPRVHRHARRRQGRADRAEGVRRAMRPGLDKFAPCANGCPPRSCLGAKGDGEAVSRRLD